MSRPRKRQRAPKAFRPDESVVEVQETAPVDPLPIREEETDQELVAAPVIRSLNRGLRWGTLLFGALAGLIGLAATLWLTTFVEEMLVRNDWIGWLALGLMALAGFAALMIALREIWALARLRRLGRLREDAERASIHGDKELASSVGARLKGLYRNREELAWPLARFAEHENDIMDAGEFLTLAERQLVAPLDAEAHAIVAQSAKRISVLTAVSPLALLDMAFVGAENLRMIRRISTAYGARPGTLSLLRLAREVVTHIVLTGGIAIGDDLIHQMIGHGLTAKLSARLGEGVFNGALTARIGIAAIDVCRPLPFIEGARPRLRDIVAKIT